MQSYGVGQHMTKEKGWLSHHGLKTFRKGYERLKQKKIQNLITLEKGNGIS